MSPELINATFLIALSLHSFTGFWAGFISSFPDALSRLGADCPAGYRTLSTIRQYSSASKLHYSQGMSIMPVVVALLLAQSQPAPQKKADSNEPVTLKGCVARDETSSGSSYTFTDSTGTKYRLAGKSVSKYSGMSVEVVGLIDRPNLVVKGGLWPSPNVAA